MHLAMLTWRQKDKLYKPKVFCFFSRQRSRNERPKYISSALCRCGDVTSSFTLSRSVITCCTFSVWYVPLERHTNLFFSVVYSFFQRKKTEPTKLMVNGRQFIGASWRASITRSRYDSGKCCIDTVLNIVLFDAFDQSGYCKLLPVLQLYVQCLRIAHSTLLSKRWMRQISIGQTSDTLQSRRVNILSAGKCRPAGVCRDINVLTFGVAMVWLE